MVESLGRFVWYELMTTDMEAARSFYAEVVGWETKDASAPGMPYSLFTQDGVSVSGLMRLSEDARRHGATPGWIGYVSTADVDAAADRTRHLGGTVHVGPMDIPGVSRIAVVSDPQSTRLGLLRWRPPFRDRVASPGTPGHVGWYDLLAADGPRAFPFYGELFGWDRADIVASRDRGAYQLFSAGGRVVGGMFTKPAVVAATFWLYYFTVDDIDAAARRVEAGGGRVLNGPTEGPSASWIVHGTDPEGVMFALMGQRQDDGGPRRIEAQWSSDWKGRSIKGRLRITDLAPPGSGSPA